MAELPNYMEMNNEYEAWQCFVNEFREVFPAEELNDSKFNPMVRAIEAWGELLVELRMAQSEGQRAAIRGEKLLAYLTVHG